VGGGGCATEQAAEQAARDLLDLSGGTSKSLRVSRNSRHHSTRRRRERVPAPGR